VVQDITAQQSGAHAPDTILVVPYGMVDELKARIEVDWWRDSHADDVAFLRLEGPVPDCLQSLPLGTTENCNGHNFETLGFPALNPKDGVRGAGHILGSVRLSGHEVLQISSNEVTPGFSGAPVWDVAARRVVGMVCKVTSADAYGRLTETAFVTPTETLQSVCPEIKAVDVCPYRGLLAFTEADAKFFFGREELVEELTEHLRHSPKLLAVVGSSGSGKSSLVQAGLIPYLRQIPGFEKSQVVYFRPGAAPVDALRRALLASQIAIELSGGIAEITDQIIEVSRNARLVLLADQFEEAFALSPDSERIQFIGCLANLVNRASAVTLLLTLRADFYDPLLRSQLGQLVKFGQAIVLPMSRRELESAITKPAEATGLQLEPGLTDRILEESADIEQPLPLLEFALTQLWEKRENGLLTHSAYSAIGRVGGALGSWATDAYTSLVPRESDLARRIFTNLVHFGKSGAPDTRRRLSVDELTSISTDPDSVRRIVLYLASRRLLVTDRDPSTGDAYAEIVHDALLSEWGQLRSWIKEDHPFLSWRQWLQERIQEWREKQEDPGGLLRGGLLAEARQQVSGRAADLTPSEREYIELSHQLQSREQARLEQLSIDAERRKEELKRGQEETLHERQVSLARHLASQAEAIRTEHPELVERSVLLAVESIRRFRTLEADQALRHGLDLLPRAIARVIHGDEVRCLAFSPTGRFLATGSDDNTARVTEVQTGREIARVVHQSGVTSVRFSLDSKLLATASMDCTARVLELVTGKQNVEVVHDLQVYSVDISPDGSLLATASMDSTARIWRMQDGKELLRLAHGDQVRTAKFSPDGRFLATASWDSSSRVWETASGRELSCFMHEDRVQAVAFSPDAAFLLTGSMDRSARVWSLSEQKERMRLLHSGEVSDVAVSMDGKLLASASWDRTARIWDIASGRELTRITHGGNVYAVLFSPHGKFVATAGVDHTARLFDAITGAEIARMCHSGRLHGIAFSQDSRMLASASSDRTARVWEADKCSATPRMVHEDGVYDLKFSPDGKLMGTGSMDATARVWEPTTGRELLRLVHDAGVNAIEFSRDSRLLATACMDCTARIWDLMNGDQVLRVEHDFQVYSVDFSPDRRFIASGSMDHTARIWDTATGGEVARLQHADQVHAVRFAADGQFVVTASSDSTARVWEVAAAREVACFPHGGPVEVAVFSRDGTLVITGSSDRTARIWDVRSSKEVVRLHHEDRVCAILLSPDERVLATASWDRTARLWSLPTCAELGTLRHEHQVCALDFDPKGEFLATASWDRTARVWELSSGQEIARLGHDERIYAVAFSPDGRFVATASMDCTTQLRLWQKTDLIAQGCGRLTRNLTYEEWHHYLGSEPYRKTCPDLP
jgi:WD40 repeat protein